MDVSVRPSTEHRQLRLFASQRPAGAPVWARLVQAASELVMSSSLRLEQWRSVVVGAVRERYRHNARTAQKVAAEATRLFRFLAACGAECWSDVTSALVLEWCWAARRDRSGVHRRTAPATARNRQWTALAVFREAAALGVPIDPETLVGERIARPRKVESARPLTDEELASARSHADTGLGVSRRPLLLALAAAGGTASEIATVRWSDINLDAGTVSFRGAAARTCPLDEWGIATVRQFMQNHPASDTAELVGVTTGSPPERAAHSVTVRLGQILQDADIAGRPGVTARSFRLTSARKILDSDSIEAAARFMGSVSLDTVADALGHDWRNDG